MNVKAWLEFELTHFHVVVKGTPLIFDRSTHKEKNLKNDPENVNLQWTRFLISGQKK